MKTGFALRMPLETKQQAEKLALHYGMSLNEFINQAIEKQCRELDEEAVFDDAEPELTPIDIEAIAVGKKYTGLHAKQLSEYVRRAGKRKALKGDTFFFKGFILVKVVRGNQVTWFVRHKVCEAVLSVMKNAVGLNPVDVWKASVQFEGYSEEEMTRKVYNQLTTVLGVKAPVDYTELACV